MYPPSPYDTKITLSPPTPGESSDNNRDDIQIYWQASQSNLLHQLAGTQLTKLPPPPPLSPPPIASPLRRKGASSLSNIIKPSHQSMQARRSKSHNLANSTNIANNVGTDREDSDDEYSSSKRKKKKVQKENTELDVLIEKVQRRLERERSSNSSFSEYTPSSSKPNYDSIPQLNPSTTYTHSNEKHNNAQNQQIQSQTRSKSLGMRRSTTSQSNPNISLPNQRFKPPQIISNNSNNFPPKTQSRSNQSQNPPIEKTNSIIDLSSDSGEYSCGEDLDLDELEQVCAQFD